MLKDQEPMAVGPYAVSNYCMEAKKAQAEAMIRAKDAILQVAKEFEAISGRSYGLFEEYQMEDALYAIVAIGSVCGTAKDAIDRLRAGGMKVGLIKVRVFRPFPGEELAEALRKVKAAAIMDRCESYSAQGGPLGAELTAAMYRAGLDAKTVNIVYGLSGRDVRVEDIEQVYADLREMAEEGKTFAQYPYLGLRER